MRYAVIDECIREFESSLFLMGYDMKKDSALFASITELNIELVNRIQMEIQKK
jgi:hypothetical protein